MSEIVHGTIKPVSVRPTIDQTMMIETSIVFFVTKVHITGPNQTGPSGLVELNASH